MFGRIYDVRNSRIEGKIEKKKNRQNLYLELEFPQNDHRSGFRAPQNPRN